MGTRSETFVEKGKGGWILDCPAGRFAFLTRALAREGKRLYNRNAEAFSVHLRCHAVQDMNLWWRIVCG